MSRQRGSVSNSCNTLLACPRPREHEPFQSASSRRVTLLRAWVQHIVSVVIPFVRRGSGHLPVPRVPIGPVDVAHQLGRRRLVDVDEPVPFLFRECTPSTDEPLVHRLLVPYIFPLTVQRGRGGGVDVPNLFNVRLDVREEPFDVLVRFAGFGDGYREDT